MGGGARGWRVRILSLGAGVQSTTLLLMAWHREIEPIDGAVFADTQWEPAAIYKHLDALTLLVSDDIPIHRVTSGSLRDDSLAKAGHIVSMPAFVLNPNGTKGQLRRQCTQEYKLRAIKRQVRELGATATNPAEMLIGISWDEWHRVHDSDVRYMLNVYPLIDRKMTRQDCEAWLTGHGYGIPQKSACIGCPFRSAQGWRDLTPAEREDANQFDDSMRAVFHTRSIKGEVFLHPSLRPLRTIDFRSEQERGQLDLWSAECAGVCGV